MMPIPPAQFDETIKNLKFHGFIIEELDGSIVISDKGDAYLERLMHDKPDLFVLMFLFYLQSAEENNG